jgi:hypothetical protein
MLFASTAATEGTSSRFDAQDPALIVAFRPKTDLVSSYDDVALIRANRFEKPTDCASVNFARWGTDNALKSVNAQNSTLQRVGGIDAKAVGSVVPFGRVVLV